MPNQLHVLITYSSGLDTDVEQLYIIFIVNVNSLKFPLTLQRRSHLFLVGAAEIERRRGECERRRREGIIGGSWGMPPPPPPENFKQTVRFRAFWDEFKQNFVSFWKHFFWYLNIVMERRNLCDGTNVLPYIVSWTACFLCFVFFFSSPFFRCVCVCVCGGGGGGDRGAFK